MIPFCLFEDAINAWFASVTADDTQRCLIGWALFGSLALDIVLPVPSSLASTLCGVVFGFWGGFWISFMAMNVSCLLGYLIGRLCAPLAQRWLGESESKAVSSFYTRYGTWMLIALRAVPVLAEASVLFAGLIRMHPGRAALLLLLGDAGVSAIYAWVGSLGHSTDNMLPAFLGSIALSGLIMLAARLAGRRRPPHSTE